MSTALVHNKGGLLCTYGGRQRQGGAWSQPDRSPFPADSRGCCSFVLAVLSDWVCVCVCSSGDFYDLNDPVAEGRQYSYSINVATYEYLVCMHLAHLDRWRIANANTISLIILIIQGRENAPGFLTLISKQLADREYAITSIYIWSLGVENARCAAHGMTQGRVKKTNQRDSR